MEDGRLAEAVIGIGINVNWPVADMPQEVRERATSLLELAGSPIDRVTLLAGVLGALDAEIAAPGARGVARRAAGRGLGARRTARRRSTSAPSGWPARPPGSPSRACCCSTPMPAAWRWPWARSWRCATRRSRMRPSAWEPVREPGARASPRRATAGAHWRPGPAGRAGRPGRSAPRSRPSTAATWTASTATPSTSSATTTTRRTRPSASSWPPCAPCPDFRDQGSTFRAWLFRIAHNTIANAHRSRARRRTEPLPDDFQRAAPERRPGGPGGAWPTSSARSGARSPRCPMTGAR